MELRVKQKNINGSKLMGIINENIKEIVPFEFENIDEVRGYSYKYFKCTKKDGTCSLYDEKGNCLISSDDGYKDLKVLKYSIDNYYRLYVVAKKDGKVGILGISFKRKEVLLKPSEIKVEVLYEFGECDEIIEFDDDNVQLIKHTKNEDLIGYWYHKNIGELVEPKFLGYNYYTIKCKQGVGLYSFKDGNGDKRHDSYRLSDYVEYDKLTLNVEMIKYSKLKDKKKVVGLKQKVYDSSKSSYHPSFKFEDFIPAIYSNISYDEEKQIFFLEQTINGQLKKGFMGVTFDWHFGVEGCWIWGYPNFKTKVNVPCEYDDIKIIKDKYALVKKEGKYGLIEFSFGKSNGDWDYYNRKNVADGKCREIVPCIYDSILRVGNYFIGQINDEERIITDYIDAKTKQSVVIANNYKKVIQIGQKVFLGNLKNGKKEVTVIKEHSKYHYWQDKTCSITKISPCDNASVILDGYSFHLIKVTNDDITDVYSVSDKEELEKFAENIADIVYDEKNDFCIITKNNGHIEYVKTSGKVIFTTDGLKFEPNNVSVTYLKAINRFRVTNNNLTKIYHRLDANPDNQTFENRLFSCFETLQTNNYTFVGYTEILEDGLITKLAHVDVRDSMKETEILQGNFQVENIVLGGKRIIFSTIVSQDGKKKYGVIEAQEGNICIDCIYDNIGYDSKHNVFVCSSNDEQTVFDIDGFISENQTVGSVDNSQETLKLTLQNSNILNK